MDQLRFEDGQTPRLLYATRQVVNTSTVTRALHRHEDCTELLYVYQGARHYEVEGYRYPIHSGDMLLYNQGSLHEVTSASRHEIGTICFGLADVRLRGLSPGHLTAPANGFVRPSNEHTPRFHMLSHFIYEQAEQNSAYTRTLIDYLVPAFVLMAVNLPSDSRTMEQPHNIVLANRIRAYIGTHYAEPLTLASIGQALSISPYHLAHVFKAVTGLSPVHYMIRCRIGEAQNLLISTDYSATQIAAIVGYASVQHFNTIFTKLVGLPPIRYRKQYLQNLQGQRTQ